MTTSAELPVLDFRALSDAQLATAQAIFDEFRDKELKPAYLADADPNRALLDRKVICDLLWASTRTPTRQSAASPPSGAPSLRCKVMAASRRPKDATFVT